MTDETAAMDAYIASPEGLRTTLTVLDRLGPSGWDTLPVARELLAHVQSRFTPVARAWHRPPEDAVFAAFMAMRGRSVRHASDPWGVVTRAVELSMQAETTAERLLISTDKARRPTHRPSMTPVRAGEHEQYLVDIAATPTPSHPSDGVDPLIATVAAYLAVHGWRHDIACRAVEIITMRTADLASRDSALDTLRRDDAARLRLGLTQRAWTGLTTLLLGRSTGHDDIGVLGRVLLGDTLADLIADTRLRDRAVHLRPGAA